MSTPSREREPGGGGGAWRDPRWLALLALAFALRAAPVWRYPDFVIWNDESLHYLVAVVAANVESAVLGHWPPGYEAFLIAIFDRFGPSLQAARWAQVLLSTLTVGLVHAIALRSAGQRAAWIAGLLCALQPCLIAYAHYLYSETLFAFLLVAALACLQRDDDGDRPAARVGAGLLFGAAALTRSLPLYFLPCWIAWLALRRRWDELRRFALVAALAFACVAPWMLRNAISYHTAPFLDGTLGRTLWWAYNEAPYRVDLGFTRIDALKRNREPCATVASPQRTPLPPVEELRRFFPPAESLDARTARRLSFELALVRDYAVRDLRAYDRCETARALAFVREKPAVALQRVLERVYLFWGPNSFLLRSVALGSYSGGPLGRAAYPWVEAAVWIGQALLLFAALLRLGTRLDRTAEWILLYTLFSTALHALSVSASRYRMPLLPLFAVLAGSWLARPQWPQSASRRTLVVALLLGFGLLQLHYGWTVLP